MKALVLILTMTCLMMIAGCKQEVKVEEKKADTAVTVEEAKKDVPTEAKVEETEVEEKKSE